MLSINSNKSGGSESPYLFCGLILCWEIDFCVLPCFLRHGQGSKLLQYSRLMPNNMAKEANSQEISLEIPVKSGTRPERLSTEITASEYPYSLGLVCAASIL